MAVEQFRSAPLENCMSDSALATRPASKVGARIIRLSDVEPYSPANHGGTVNRRLIGRETGARHMEVLQGDVIQGGHTTNHAHPGLEQAVYFIEGTAKVELDGVEDEVHMGDIVFMPEGSYHAFEITSETARLLVIYSPPYGENASQLVLKSDQQVSDLFTMTSPDFGPDQPFSQKFLFDRLDRLGENVSPALEWDHPPVGTKSFALMVHDAHAITGGAGIWHWVVVDIPASARSIAQGAGTPDGAGLPAGSRQIKGDIAGFADGSAGWGGPCPPVGHSPHDYIFTLYALPEERLELPQDATPSHYGFVINRLALGKAELIGRYGR